jgi:biotin transport system substrate-specific component
MLEAHSGGTRSRATFWGLALVVFPLITALAAWFGKFSIPGVSVPFTLQTVVVLLVGALLGPVLGTWSMLAYLAYGACGLPVFARGADRAGLEYLLQGVTSGYLLAFPVAALVVGLLLQRHRQGRWSAALAFLLGSLLILVCGAGYAWVVLQRPLDVVVWNLFLVFVPFALVKAGLATWLYRLATE